MRSSDEFGWLRSMCTESGNTVGRYLPEGLANYVRVFHPAYRRGPGTVAGGGVDVSHVREPVRWREIAQAVGRSLPDEMRQLGVDCRPSRFAASGSSSGLTPAARLWDTAPRVGELPSELGTTLVTLLARHTSRSDSVYWGVWDGYATDYPDDYVGTIDLAVPRRYRIYQRTLGDVERSFMESIDHELHPPNLWWPADRAWCVSTEINFRWTYVGGSNVCVSQILSDTSIESIPTYLSEGNLMEV
jgi:hypothetical protein